MISKTLTNLLNELGLTLSGVNMGVHTRKVLVWLTDAEGHHYTGSAEKGGAIDEIKALDRAIGEALSRNFPGWSALWLRRRRYIEKSDPYSGEVLEVVC